ncbi:hypothetical protein MVLG_03871 [Microbotryum lychnidis-dioicae p1A1 Lamole]|uniref:Uncharacterized protein n=1 Tax=Microbotryum lychnidis-dioicae (strain p1A1 Lamole / MvSl-1064) TaxID=683840 RepID=U5H9I0_USTV1|nr:hypothetical protein MVLG_03871 [Microbotryum lychnidis-dioicae p1A1 Lamole]|eukprot:KDE05780.1 hypothetical protein MVLG_03871 [Microbotryum lychnidis-dioicae p1A1 Lamole]
MSSRNSETIDWRGCAEQAEGALELQQLEAERDLACAQRDLLQARVAALEIANEDMRGRIKDLEHRDGVKVEDGMQYQLVPKVDPVSAGASTGRFRPSAARPRLCYDGV